MIRKSIILLVSLMASSCSYVGLDRFFGESDVKDWLETEASTTSEIPQGLDQPKFVDLMPIPDVIDYRGLTGQTIEVGLPDALNTGFAVEQIVIRRLGDERWVFLDLPTAVIWPQMVLFWEENQLPVASLDPRQGVLETEWLMGAYGNPDEIYESLTSSAAWSFQPKAQQYKFRVRIEPGVRTGSSELYIEQKQRRIGEQLEVDWDSGSDNSELEGKLLSVMAYYLGDRMVEGPKVSLLAAGLQESKANLITQPTGMVLSYKLDLDRAWATVGAALEDAKVTVDDLDRSSGIFYVTYSSRHDPNPGFLSRVLGRRTSELEVGEGHSFQVLLDGREKEVLVTVAVGEEQVDDVTRNLILRERLLKLIKEYST